MPSFAFSNDLLHAAKPLVIDQPILIASRAAIITFAVLAAVLLVLSLIGAVRKKPDHAGDIIGRVIGASIVLAIPLGIAAVGGLIASAVLLGVGAPPMTYAFIGLASLVSFRAAVKHPGHGMEGCTKLFGLVAGGYAMIWSGVSFATTGGLDSLESDTLSLRWLQPPLAALPFALAVLKLTDSKKRTAWLSIGSWVFVAAVMALCFFPIERGFARAVLPAIDWLRFPLAGIAIVAILALVRLALYWRLKPSIRRVRIRDLRTSTRILALIMAAMGLSWAAARALVTALV